MRRQKCCGIFEEKRYDALKGSGRNDRKEKGRGEKKNSLDKSQKFTKRQTLKRCQNRNTRTICIGQSTKTCVYACVCVKRLTENYTEKIVKDTRREIDVRFERISAPYSFLWKKKRNKSENISFFELFVELKNFSTN